MFFSSANSQSQISIMGKVISEENQRGLQGVDVYIEKFGIGATSSEAGDFLLKDVPQRKVSLRFSMIV